MSRSSDGWVRHGDCNGCGACCRVLLHPLTVRVRPPLDDPHYLQVRGVTVVDGWAMLTGSLVAPCPELTTEQRCALHGTDAKPRYCQDYPTAPEQIAAFPCSYWFTRDGEAWGGQASPHPGRTRVAAVA